MRHLQTAVGEGLQPARTSGVGHLCGARALAVALRPIRYSIFLREPREEGIIDITDEDVMGFLFLDYDHVAANDPNSAPVPGLQGTPTPDYAELLEEMLGDLRVGDETIYNDVYQQMTSMNNIALDQLSASLELMYRAGWLDRRYAIGVVRAPIAEGSPATAQIHGAQDDDTPIVWLYNDGFEDADGIGNVSHWEGFELPHGNDSGLRRITAWGLVIPDAASMPAPRFSAVGRANETAEQKRMREKLNIAAKLSRDNQRLRKSCLRCQEKKLLNCNVVVTYNSVAQQCSSCDQEGTDCNVPQHITAYSGPKKASEVTDADILPWLTPVDWNKINSWIEGAKPEEEPTVKHWLTIATGRLSSNGGPADFQRLITSIPVTAHKYDTALAGGRLPNQEGVRPAPVMRTFLMGFCRQGTRAIPTALGNRLTDPFLIGFVNLIRHVTRPNNPNTPVEIHHLIQGIAGFSVGIGGWGNRQAGYFKFLLDADRRNGNRHFEDNTYIVAVVEPHVVDGVAASALDHPAASPYYFGYSGKYVSKYKLRSLVDRLHVKDVLAAGAQVQRPAYYEPHWDDDQRNDHFLRAIGEEWGWRANQYDGTTTPTDALIQARNTNRNRPW